MIPSTMQAQLRIRRDITNDRRMCTTDGWVQQRQLDVACIAQLRTCRKASRAGLTGSRTRHHARDRPGSRDGPANGKEIRRLEAQAAAELQQVGNTLLQ